MPPSTRKIRPEVWERHKRTILDLWLNERLPLKGSNENGRNLMQVMQDEHDFHATASQYETKIRLWGATKNLRKRDWQTILPLYNELERQGHAPRVRVGEHIFTESKIKRARREYLKAGLIRKGDNSEQAPPSDQKQTRLWRLEVRQDDGQYSEYSNTCLDTNSLGTTDSSNIAHGNVQRDLPVTTDQRLHTRPPSPLGISSMRNTTELESMDYHLRLNSPGDPSFQSPDQPISSDFEPYTLPPGLDIDFDRYALPSEWENDIGTPISHTPFTMSPPEIFFNNSAESIHQNNLLNVESPSLGILNNHIEPFLQNNLLSVQSPSPPGISLNIHIEPIVQYNPLSFLSPSLGVFNNHIEPIFQNNFLSAQSPSFDVFDNQIEPTSQDSFLSVQSPSLYVFNNHTEPILQDNLLSVQSPSSAGISPNNQIELPLRSNLPGVQSPSSDVLRSPSPSLLMVNEELVSPPVAGSFVEDFAASSTQALSESISLREISGRILNSIVNNFAGLEGVDFPTIFNLLELVPGMESYFLEWLRSDNPMISKPLAKNLFRAAIEAGNEEVVDTVLKTTSGRINQIDVDETILSDGARYSPIALASSRVHSGIVKTLLLHGAQVRIPDHAPKEVEYYGCPLKVILETWDKKPDPPPEKQVIQIFELIAIHEPPDAPELFSLILYRMQNTNLWDMRTENDFRISREMGTKLLEILFQTIPKERYPELFSRKDGERLNNFAKEIQPALYRIITKLEIPIANNIAQSLLNTHVYIQFMGNQVEELKEALILSILRNNTDLTEYLLRLIKPDDRHLTAAVHVGNLALVDSILGDSILGHGVSAHGRLMCSEHIHYASVDSHWWTKQETGIEKMDRKCPVGREKGHPCKLTTPLAEAIRLQNIQLIHQLENCGALDALLSEKGELHFEAAARASGEVGNFSYLKQLLDLNPHPTSSSLLGPIQNAMESEHFETAWDLITQYSKAGSNRENMDTAEVHLHMTEILSTIIRNRGGLEFLEQVIEYLDCFGYLEEFHGINLLAEAARIDDRSIIEYFVHLDHRLLSRSTSSETPLIVAVERHNVELARLLLEWGAPPRNSLEKAVATGDEAIVRLFLSHGADLEDEEAFLEAVKSNNKSLLPILLSKFSSIYPDGRKGFGGPALVASIQTKDITTLGLLLQAKFDVNTPSSGGLYGGHLLIRAIQMLEEDYEIFREIDDILYRIIRRILEAGANIEATDLVRGKRVSALLQAIISNDIRMVELLLDKGADINRPAKRGLKRTPLQQACEQGGFQMVKYLLGRDADIHAPPAVNGGATALQLAAIKGNMRIVRLLVNLGANINEVPAAVNGRTALQGAAEHGRLSVLGLLLVEGKDIYTSTDIGSARKYAERNGHRGCVERLRLAMIGREAIL